MTREEKNISIENLKESLQEAKNLYLTDIAGLNAAQTSALRRACFKAGIKLSVVKNTMLANAMEDSNTDYGALKDILKGNTSLMFSETGNAPAKVIKEFRKKSDKPLLKGAFIEEAIYVGDDQLEILTALKSKDELIGDFVMWLKSPSKNVVSALQSGSGKLAGIVQTLAER